VHAGQRGFRLLDANRHAVSGRLSVDGNSGTVPSAFAGEGYGTACEGSDGRSSGRWISTKLAGRDSLGVGACRGQVWDFIRSQPGLSTDGHNVFLYHHPKQPGGPILCEFGVEVTRTFENAGEVYATETPGGEAAVAVHRGPYNRVGSLRNWSGTPLRALTQNIATQATGAVLCCGPHCSKLCPNLKGENSKAALSIGLRRFVDAWSARWNIVAETDGPTVHILPQCSVSCLSATPLRLSSI